MIFLLKNNINFTSIVRKKHSPSSFTFVLRKEISRNRRSNKNIKKPTPDKQTVCPLNRVSRGQELEPGVRCGQILLPSETQPFLPVTVSGRESPMCQGAINPAWLCIYRRQSNNHGGERVRPSEHNKSEACKSERKCQESMHQPARSNGGEDGTWMKCGFQRRLQER